MASKTIWFINDYAGSKYHGMEFRNYYVAKELVKLGYKVYIISASYMHLFKKLPQITGEYTFEDIDGIHYVWVKVPHYTISTDKRRVWKWFVFTKKLYTLPKGEMQKPDFIIASPMAPFLLMPTYHLAKRYKAKFIYEIKDIWPLSLMELGGYSKNHPLIWLMQKFANFGYKNADLTLSVLPYAYEYMKDFGLKKENFRYIPNGISTDEIKDKKSLNTLTKDKLPNDKFIVGYAGTIGTANALDSFIEAGMILKDHDDIRLVLVGEGKDKEKLVKKANDANLNNIIFINSIPKDEVQSLLKSFDICFIGWHDKRVYKYGISANKLFDYMYSSKPVLHAFSGDGDLIALAKCGLTVPARDASAIAKGILNLYNLSDEKRKKLGENGRRYVIEHHTYTNITKEFIEAIDTSKS